MDRLKNKRTRIIFPIIFLLAGIVLMVAGIWRGELEAIFTKGSIVCLECIGIG